MGMAGCCAARWRLTCPATYYDWADRRADLRNPDDRPSPVPAQLAYDVSRGAPEVLARLGLLAHDMVGEEPLPQSDVIKALMDGTGGTAD
eukprot:116878-Alexandrium_andersonii.AAC.1